MTWTRPAAAALVAPPVLVVLAALAVLVLAGCGGAGPGPSASPAPSQPVTTSQSSSLSIRPSPSVMPSAPARPVRVAIPALDLDERLVDLGLTGTGALEVPQDPARVGWFTGGGRPGGPGPTVVVGHLDSTSGPAVFARLPELGPGDEVVVTSDGPSGPTATTYVVEEARDVPQDTFPTTEVFGASPDDVLRLITCTGPYDSAAGRYTENRVVTARPA